MSEQLTSGQSIYVYELPLRIWHWVMVICVSVLIITGYIIGKPWLSVTGQAWNVFYMGYTKLAHFTAGFILIIATVFRICFSIVGNKYSRELFWIPVWTKQWWKGLWGDILWYSFVRKSPEVYIGHNPLAQAGMGAGLLFMIVIMLSGLGLLAAGSTNEFIRVFIFMQDFMYYLGGNEQTLRSLHRLGMLLLVSFVIIHLYMVMREEIMGKTSLVSAMFSGFRMKRD